MDNQTYFRIVSRHGSKPMEIVVGQNPDGDTRYRLDVTYSYQGEKRRRSWFTRTQLESIHALLGAFLTADADMDETHTAVSNGTSEP